MKILRNAPVLIATIFLALAGTAVQAGSVTSDGPDIVIKTKGGFEARTKNGDFSFKIGGRIQLDYNHYDGLFNADEGGDTGSDVFFRRLRLAFSGTVKKDWAYKLQYDFESEETQDIYIRYKGQDIGSLIFGKHKTPAGLEALVSSKYITAIERSAPTNAFAYGRLTGISLAGSAGSVYYQVGLFDGDEERGSSNEDDDVDWLFAGRVALPIEGSFGLLHLGASYTFLDTETGAWTLDAQSSTYNLGSATSLSERPEIRDTDSSDRIRSAAFAYDGISTYGVELGLIAGPFHLQAEYFDATYDDGDRAPGAASAEDIERAEEHSFDGYYVQAGYFLSGEKRPYKKSRAVFDKLKPRGPAGAWEVFARYSELDYSDGGGNTGEVATLGLNWYINANVRAAINYVHAEYDNPVGDEDDGDAIAMRLQLIF